MASGLGGACSASPVLQAAGRIPMPANAPAAHASTLLAMPADHPAALQAYWFAGSRESGPDVQIASLAVRPGDASNGVRHLCGESPARRGAAGLWLAPSGQPGGLARRGRDASICLSWPPAWEAGRPGASCTCARTRRSEPFQRRCACCRCPGCGTPAIWCAPCPCRWPMAAWCCRSISSSASSTRWPCASMPPASFAAWCACRSAAICCSPRCLPRSETEWVALLRDNSCDNASCARCRRRTVG